MKLSTTRYEKSVYLFPAIEVSDDLNYLKQLYTIINLKGEPIVFMKDGKNWLIHIKTGGETYRYMWFGDCIWIFKEEDEEDEEDEKDEKDGEKGQKSGPKTPKAFFFIGFINNVLMGFGNLNYEVNEKYLKKSKLRYETYSGQSFYDLKVILEALDRNEYKISEILKRIGSDLIEVRGVSIRLPYKSYKGSTDLIKWAGKEEFRWEKVLEIFLPSFKWYLRAPRIFSEDLENIWDDLWILHRVSMYNPEEPFKYRWSSPCRVSNYQFNKIAMWDTIHIIEDLKWYDINLCKDLLRLHFEMFREEDGKFAQDRSCTSNYDGLGGTNEDNNQKRDKTTGNYYEISQPPLWSYTYLELAKLMGDYNYIPDAYNIMVENIKWWEKNRYFEDYNLFGYDSAVWEMAVESGYDNSPKFYYQYNGKKWKRVKRTAHRKLITVELNAQMADYYQNMGVLGMINNDENYVEYFNKAEKLIDNMHEILWDADRNFFFDFDLEYQCQQPLYSSSAFWTLFGGCVIKGDLDKFLANLLDPHKFWSEMPLPSISLDSPFYNKNMWSGPSWLSQNYWTIIGLKRYNKGDLAARLSQKIINYLFKSYKSYQKIFEFYNPINTSQNKLLRKSSNRGPYPYYLGHFPFHSIFYYGMLGAEICDGYINFIPDKNILNENIGFEIYYNNKKYSYPPKSMKKLIEIYFDSN